MTRQGGSVMVFALTVLAMLGILGASLSRSATARWLAATEYRDGACRHEDDPAQWQRDSAPCDHRERRDERVDE
jgi:hypothetical protein